LKTVRHCFTDADDGFIPFQGEGRYDVVLCSKMVNEMYRLANAKRNSQANVRYFFYAKLIHNVGALLDRDDGVFYLSDVTDCLENQDVGSFFPKILQNNVTAYRQKFNDLHTIYPISCIGGCSSNTGESCFAQLELDVQYRIKLKEIQDKSKITCRVFAGGRVAAEFKPLHSAACIYKISPKNSCQNGRFLRSRVSTQAISAYLVS
jgi:hypothetical protein